MLRSSELLSQQCQFQSMPVVLDWPTRCLLDHLVDDPRLNTWILHLFFRIVPISSGDDRHFSLILTGTVGSCRAQVPSTTHVWRRRSSATSPWRARRRNVGASSRTWRWSWSNMGHSPVASWRKTARPFLVQVWYRASSCDGFCLGWRPKSFGNWGYS